MPALAQAAAVVPGMQVVDSAGNPVGSIVSTNGANVVLNTGTHQVQLPATSFTPGNGTLLFGMTKAQVDAAAEQAQAQANAALAAGANVYGKGGTLAGTIDSIDADYVTIKLATGGLVRIPRNGIAASPNGNGAVLGISVAELQQAAAQAQGATSPPANSTTPPSGN